MSVEKLYGYKLCSNHFEDSQFMNKDAKNKLIWSAIPTLFDVPNPPSKLTSIRVPVKRHIEENVRQEKAPRLTEKCSEREETPTKKKLRRAVNKYKKRLSRSMKNIQKKGKKPKVEHVMQTLKTLGLAENTLTFLEEQLRLCQKKKNGYRYTIKDKMLALSIYYQSSKAYKLLRKIFILPSKSTIQKSLQNTNISPGFSDTLLQALKLKVQTMDNRDTNVALVFDEMALKSALVYHNGLDLIEGFEDLGESGRNIYVADHALVFMVRGLFSKWKQPLAYFVTSGPIKGDNLHKVAKACLAKLEGIGLSVRVLICDQGSNNRNFIETHEKVTIERPYFIHNGRKVFVVYDPPHLLKNVRNNLKKGNLLCGNEVISWQHITDFYNFDKKLSIRMAPKLTDKHIELPPFTSMRVNLAAQVFSHSVAAGINSLATMKYLPSDACATAEFLETFDQLFNSFNSFSFASNSQKFRIPFHENSGHWPFLQGCLRFMAKIKTENGKVLPCMRGWQISINALGGLWEELNSCGFKYLLTNRLNQDCAESLFSVIRGRGGFRDNPNPEQFRATFRHIVVDKLFAESSFSNCQFDCDKVLLDISSLTIHQKKIKARSNPQILTDVTRIVAVTTPDLSLPEKNVAAYISGYLLRKFPIDDCEFCSSFFEQKTFDESSEFSTHEYIRNKNYKSKGCLLIPTKAFATFVESLERSFNMIFPACMHLPGVLETLMKNSQKEIQDFEKCDKENCKARVRCMVKLYMKIKIYHTLKMSNISNHLSTGNKRNRKILKLMHV